MRSGLLVLLSLLALPSQAVAQRALICFGNEPSWGVDLSTPGSARVTSIGEAPVTYQGKAATLTVPGETMWRGTAGGRDLVVFMRDAACSDGMSDVEHPVTARVSLPDGRFLAGCCRVPAGSTSQAGIEGVAWRLTALTGQDAGALGSRRAPVTARFEDGRVTGFSGCNRFTGSYTAAEGRVTIGQLAGTLMACEPADMALEKAFRAAFSGVFAQSGDGDALTLTADSGTVLTFVKDAGRLDGITWNVTGYNNGREAVVSPIMGSAITLTFADGNLSGTAGCNNFRAAYTVEGNRIAIKAPIATRKACSPELMEQERLFLAALESSVTVAIEGGALDMHGQGGERTVHAASAR